MKRLSFISMTAAILTMAFASFGLIVTNAFAQDVTITIKKGDDKPDSKPPFTGKRPAVDVAILLDTSNSMDGLINQAKTQLWKIVQQFGEAEKAGKTPELRVSIFEYGNSGLPASEGYIRQVVSLTDDLDKVSEALFALKTNGGDEYCGQVIDEALKRLDWSSQPNAYKAIFIAGNEPFTQGPVSYNNACKKAIQSGVVVNTIHCGAYKAGVSGMWQQGASLAEGEFLNINQDRAVVHVKSPQDKIIIELNRELNKTYLWFGDSRTRKYYSDNQIAQDKNAFDASGGAGFGGGRGKTKASKAYGNRGRDLVDTLEEKPEILSTLKTQSLPESMQGLNAKERKEYVQKMATKRGEIQQKMKDAIKQRDAYVAGKRKELADADESTFGDAIVQAVQKQLKESGFELNKNE